MKPILAEQLYQKQHLLQNEKRFENLTNISKQLPSVKFAELITGTTDNLAGSSSIISNSFDLEHRHKFSLVGTTTSTDINISAQVSHDNITFFDYPSVYVTKLGNNIFTEHKCGFKYIKFTVQNTTVSNITISMQISSKK